MASIFLLVLLCSVAVPDAVSRGVFGNSGSISLNIRLLLATRGNGTSSFDDLDKRQCSGITCGTTCCTTGSDCIYVPFNFSTITVELTGVLTRLRALELMLSVRVLLLFRGMLPARRRDRMRGWLHSL
jgi:hypothetical protein